MKLWARLEDELNRIEKNWRWLGKISAVPESTISRWRDSNKYPTADKAIKMAQAIGRSVEYLVTGNDPTGLSEKSLKVAFIVEQLTDEGKEVALTQVKGLITHFAKKEKHSATDL
jgi:transcriptional regulator with XRE-family HTH domain